MKNKNKQFQVFSEILFGIGIGFSIILFCLTVGIFTWGYINPKILNTNQLVELKILLQNRPWYYIVLGILYTFYCLLFGGIFFTAAVFIKKINFKKPFQELLSLKIKKIGILIITIGFVKILIQNIQYVDSPSLVLNYGLMEGYIFTLSIGFIFYILSIVIQKGIEIQEENDLTV